MNNEPAKNSATTIGIPTSTSPNNNPFHLSSHTKPTYSTLPASNLTTPSAPTTKPLKKTKKDISPKHPTESNLNAYRLAKTLLDEGQTRQAIIKLQDLVLSDPGFAPAFSLLGKVYANLEYWEQAKRWCRSAVQLDALQVEAYYVLALVYQHENQIDIAIKMFKETIYLEPGMPLAHFNLAMLYKQLAQPEHAKRTFENVIKTLAEWSPQEIVPDSGGATAGWLLEVTRQMLNKLEA